MLRIQFTLLFLGLFILTACQTVPLAAPAIATPSLPAGSSTPTSAPALSPTAIPSPTISIPTGTASGNATDVATATKPDLDPEPTATPVPTNPPLTTLLFTGVIVPARCVQAAIDANGNPNYPYEDVRDVITKADLAIGTLNATISDVSPHTGCIPTYVLVGSSNNADALAWAGFDAMSVATNHIKNCNTNTCGNRAFFDTLNNLKRVGIAYVGAGQNLAEAMQPIVLTVNGIRFGIVSLGQIEPMSFAGADTPGIAVLNKENLTAAVAMARQVSDVVIAMPHWGPEDISVPNWIQRNLAKDLVEAGADIVMGNHTHVVQAIQEINGVPVFYGLGNFVFDQDLNDHQQGVILMLKFEGKKYAGYELIPTHIDPDGRVHVAGPAEAAEILKRIEDASKALNP